MKFSIKDFFSKFDQIHSFLRFGLRIWSHLLTKLSMENFIFCEFLCYSENFFPKNSVFQRDREKLACGPLLEMFSIR